MEMIQFLEEDRGQLISSLGQAGTPEACQSVLEKELDKLLLRYNEECAEERVRDAARYILQAARMMIPMLSAAGETKIWTGSAGSGSSGKEAGMTLPAIASLVGGIVFIAGAVIGLAVSGGEGLPLPALLGAIPAGILGGILVCFSGRPSGSGSGGSPQKQDGDSHVEIRVNPEMVWNCMRGLVLSADKSLAEVQEAVRYERNRLPSASGGAVSPEEAELFSNILETAYSFRQENADDPSALEMISTVRYYLHRKQVETVDLGGGKREWFELLPGKQEMTLRPALVKDGVLVKKGLAVAAQ